MATGSTDTVGAVAEPYSAPEGYTTVWAPQRGPQTAAVCCGAREVLYGGAAGGGKTDFLLGDFLAGVEEWGSAWRGILIRKTGPEFDEIERRAIELIAPIWGERAYIKSEKTFYLPSQSKGVATLKLVPVVDDKAVLKIQGRAWNWAGIDEVGQFPSEAVLEYVRTRLRSARGAPVYIRLTANPGGIGHNWLCQLFHINEPEYWLDNGPDADPDRPHIAVSQYQSEDQVFTRVFIPSLVTDNKILMDADPAYAAQLGAIGDDNLRRALRYGDWTVSMDAAFSEFNKHIHVIPHHEPPQGVKVWCAMDWGYAKPSACYWAYVDADGYTHVFHELYTCGAKYDTGLRLDPEQVAQRIDDIEDYYGIRVKVRFLDPACWQEHQGSSIKTQLSGPGRTWTRWPADHNWRFNKKQMVHGFLKVINGDARLKIHDNCPHLIRTLGSIPTDPVDQEDVDTKAEDHPYDALCGLLHRQVKTPSGRHHPAKDFFFGDEHPGQGASRKTGRFGGW